MQGSKDEAGLIWDPRAELGNFWTNCPGNRTPRSMSRDGKISERGAQICDPCFLRDCIATRQGREEAVRVCFRRKRSVFEFTTISKAPATKCLKVNKHGYWIGLFPDKMSRNASLRGDEYRLSVYGSLIALKGAQVCAAVVVSPSGDSICTGPQSPIGLPLPYHSSRGAAINSYRITSFGRRGLASANKTDQ
jgi:hypothetical protein